MDGIDCQEFFTTESQSYNNPSAILTAKDYEKWINEYSENGHDEKWINLRDENNDNDDKV